MADNMQSELQRWQQLKQQAVSGEFRMEEGIGDALRLRCQTLVAALEDMKEGAQALAYLAGYGDLPSAKIIQSKFEKKAAGGDSHDPNDSAVARLQQHIEVVQLMHDTYAAAIGKLESTDEAAGSRMNTLTQEVR
ncbi:hypothetical protein OHA40_17485 [Nocardia sp. NBC_00508]|uniref:hypothetical protein n=1 Tax=Nocardia sp. NBC_00508 TaxID=2975992 RepID=UPI002E8062BE|nr:hypothetical protein [Nocardia sp. NBC_00508]WUD63578.1 hypothetical protein OHA40_17485 [Nocardia sp. NBC_00508]